MGTLARSSPPVPDPHAPAVLLTLKGWLVVGCIAIQAACDCVVIVPNRGGGWRPIGKLSFVK